jgi:two-component system NtrC family sensor kinase
MFNMRLELQKKKLTATIFFSSILPVALIAICIFLYALLIVDKEYKRVSASELATLSGEYRDRVHNKIESAVREFGILHTLHGDRPYSREDLANTYAILSTSMEWLDGIAILTEEREVAADTGKTHSSNLRAISTLYAGFGQTPPRVVVTDVQPGTDGIPHFFITTRIQVGGKIHIACLSANAHLFSAILDTVRIGRTGEVFLINEQGVLQTRSVLHGSILDSVDTTLAESAQQGGIVEREWQETRVWYIALPMEANPDWRLVVQRDEREILQSRDTQLARFSLLGVLCLGVLVAIALRTVRKAKNLQTNMEEELLQLTDCHIQVQKLDAISQLGVGIAHEVNNPLAIIGEEVGWMQDVLKRDSFKDHPDADELRGSLRQIVAQTARSREITHKLLSFGGKTDGIIRDVELNTLVTDIVTLRRRDASQRNIEIRTALAPKLPIILSEPALLRQLLINLISNAMDAMPEGGTITITTKYDENGGVALLVEDTGFGIPEENMNKIFDPFFTTKAPGKGAGLGLSISHGILQRIGGQIFAESLPGQGSTFTVRLPREARSKTG